MSRFWEIVFCVPMIFRRHVCLSNLKHAPSRKLPLTAHKTVFSHLTQALNNPTQAFNEEKRSTCYWLLLLLLLFFFTNADPAQHIQSPQKSLKGKLQKNAFYYIIFKENIHSNLLTAGGQLSGFVVTSNFIFLDEHETPTSDKIQNNTNIVQLSILQNFEFEHHPRYALLELSSLVVPARQRVVSWKPFPFCLI